MIATFIKKIFGTSHEREIKRLQPLVLRINELESTWNTKSDDELRAMTTRFYERLDQGEKLDRLLPEAFATVREASRRVLGMRHYDVQLIGGMVLHRGAIAEMKTGEGKTLVATCPLYLNALARKGAHLITVNDYLALRDADWMGRIYRFLGMDVGVVVHGQSESEKQRAYRCPITYGTNNEFGFDYLRDNMKDSIERYVQRGLHYAIVDEVDSILIDEARTPLIISGPAEESTELYKQVNRVIPYLRKDIDYTVDEKHHSVALTDSGVERVESRLGITNLYDPKYLSYNHHVQQALRAHALYKRDVNYMITPDNKVMIIDEFTGRLMPGRRWSDGLHQAIEAKENVNIEEETQTLATISFQNLFRLYNKLAGMTGTADTEAEEFHKIYKLDVVTIPPHRPMIRADQTDLVYKNMKGKFRAIVEEIIQCHERGQPVLVGTVSVEKSEVLSEFLQKRNVPHTVLNAKQHAREAAIVAQAGRLGAVTIATNMAGRGTDILLGGNPEFMARAQVYGEEAACRPGACDESTAEYQEALAHFRTITEAEKDKVRAAGGLHIIGTERHESRRIDNQLRGRAGRQGDPGSSRFYLSLEDDLLRVFGGERLMAWMERWGMEEDVPIEHNMLSRQIENAQRKVEAHHFDGRKNVLEYDDVMNQQRKAIYSWRRQVLEGQYTPEDKSGKRSEMRSGELDQSTLIGRLRPVLLGLMEQLKTHAASTQMAPTAMAEVFGQELYRRFGAVATLPSGTSPEQWIEPAAQAVALSLLQQRERVMDMVEQEVMALVERHSPNEQNQEDWDIEVLQRAVQEQFGVAVSLTKAALDAQSLAEAIWEQLETWTQAKETELGSGFLYFARHFLLEEIDNQWIDHLKNIDYLREGIGLRSYGQRDPKQEYKKEGFALFQEMTQRVVRNTLQKLYHLRLEQKPQEQAPPPVVRKERTMILQHGEEKEAATPATAREPVRRETPKVGRNDLCPCGSGKKYKHCHGAQA